MTEGNSVKQGVGIGIGLILLFTTLGLFPFLCSGGLFVAGAMIAPAAKGGPQLQRLAELNRNSNGCESRGRSEASSR